MFFPRAMLMSFCIAGAALGAPPALADASPPASATQTPSTAPTDGKNAPGASSADPVFRLHVKTTKIKPDKIKLRDGHIQEDQWRMLLLEGDPKHPTRTTTIIEGPANCGQFDRLEEGDLVDGDAHVLFLMACWNGGAGYTITFTQREETVSVKTATFAEEDENPIDDSRTVYSMTVPRGMRVEVVHLP